MLKLAFGVKFPKQKSRQEDRGTESSVEESGQVSNVQSALPIPGLAPTDPC